MLHSALTDVNRGGTQVCPITGCKNLFKRDCEHRLCGRCCPGCRKHVGATRPTDATLGQLLSRSSVSSAGQTSSQTPPLRSDAAWQSLRALRRPVEAEVENEDDDAVVLVGERTVEERNAEGFANAIDLDELFGEERATSIEVVVLDSEDDDSGGPELIEGGPQTEATLQTSDVSHSSDNAAHEQTIGNKLFDRVMAVVPSYACKITGMLLELGVDRVSHLMEPHNAHVLRSQIEEAMTLLSGTSDGTSGGHRRALEPGAFPTGSCAAASSATPVAEPSAVAPRGGAPTPSTSSSASVAAASAASSAPTAAAAPAPNAADQLHELLCELREGEEMRQRRVRQQQLQREQRQTVLEQKKQQELEQRRLDTTSKVQQLQQPLREQRRLDRSGTQESVLVVVQRLREELSRAVASMDQRGVGSILACLEQLRSIPRDLITVEMLKVTRVGLDVGKLRRHPHNLLSSRAKELVESWKVAVEEQHSRRCKEAQESDLNIHEPSAPSAPTAAPIELVQLATSVPSAPAAPRAPPLSLGHRNPFKAISLRPAWSTPPESQLRGKRAGSTEACADKRQPLHVPKRRKRVVIPDDESSEDGEAAPACTGQMMPEIRGASMVNQLAEASATVTDEQPRTSTKNQPGTQPPPSIRSWRKHIGEGTCMLSATVNLSGEAADDERTSIKVSERELRSLMRPATSLHISGRDVVLGERVKARYLATTKGPAVTNWYYGKVVQVHADGTVDVDYDDGDHEQHVRREYVRPAAPACQTRT